MLNKGKYKLACDNSQFRLLTKLEKDSLDLLIGMKQRKEVKFCLQAVVQRLSYDTKQRLDLQNIQEHLKDPKNFKISMDNKSFVIFCEVNLFGKIKTVQIQKINITILSSIPQQFVQASIQSKIQKPKKTILVVGRMGHGKSSFINALILPKDENAIEVPPNLIDLMVPTGAGMKSVTTKCSLYLVDETHQLLGGQQLYVIDSPGLNSEDAICLICQQIDNIIIQKRCQIIGIAYVINLAADREISGSKSSTLRKFMTLLKMSKHLKNNLLFFILSNWDNILFKNKKGEIDQCLKNFQDLVKEIQIEYKEQRLIKWTSPYCSDPQSYEFFLQKKKGTDLIKEQWVKLKSATKQYLKSSLSLELHTKNVEHFWESLLKRISSEMEENNIRYKKQYDILQYNIELNIEKIDYSMGNKLLKLVAAAGGSNFLGGISSIVAEGILSSSGVALTGAEVAGAWTLLGISTAASFVTAVSVLSIPVLCIYYALSKKQKISPQENQNSQMHINQIMKNMMIEQITLKLKSTILKNLIQSIRIEDEKIFMKEMNSIKKLNKITIDYEREAQKIPLVQINEGDKWQYLQFNINCRPYQENNQEGREYETQQLNKFSKQALEMDQRVPQQVLIFVKKNEDKIKLSFRVACRLPQQQNYYHLVTSQCEQLFGHYSLSP